MQRRPRLVATGTCALGAVLTCGLLTDVGGKALDQVVEQAVAPAAPVLATGETVRLAFAGDVHFAGELADVPSDPTSTLGPMSQTLRAADLAMVNLESAITDEDEAARKELEDPASRYWFRTGAGALDVLDRSGVDVVSVANNHGADFGVDGLRDTLRAADTSSVAVVGVGRDDRQAFAPHRVRVKDTDIAVHAADASPREGAASIWGATPGSGPGIAAARTALAPQLVEAVRESAKVDDLVVVYLHWGEEGNACSTTPQQDLARTLSAAGADIIVGTHAHTPLGAGTRGTAYVSYGLGNFYWYHGRQAETGVLSLAVQDGRVVADEWIAGRIRSGGGDPQPVQGEDRTAAVEDWQDLRGCTDLSPGPGASTETALEAPPVAPSGAEAELPAFTSAVRRIGPSVRRSMVAHDDAICPVALSDLRHVVVSYVGFDGRAREGELVVDAAVADDVVDAFETLYGDRFPIDRMRLVDDWAGDDDQSMAANNTSAYNCRRVAGTDRWSDHAYGRAVDVNPVQNPYVVGTDVRPPAGVAFVSTDRSDGASLPPGVVGEAGAVRTAFDQIGWSWGGLFTDPDFQHFSVEGG